MKAENMTQRMKRWNAKDHISQAQARDLLAAAEAVDNFHGPEHLDACASGPTWLSGAPKRGDCDCALGQLRAAIAAAKGVTK